MSKRGEGKDPADDTEVHDDGRLESLGSPSIESLLRSIDPREMSRTLEENVSSKDVAVIVGSGGMREPLSGIGGSSMGCLSDVDRVGGRDTNLDVSSDFVDILLDDDLDLIDTLELLDMPGSGGSSKGGGGPIDVVLEPVESTTKHQNAILV